MQAQHVQHNFEGFDAVNLGYMLSQGPDDGSNDVIIIGSQESGPDVQSWRARIMRAAGTDWQHVVSDILLGIVIVVLAHSRAQQRLGRVQTCRVATGQPTMSVTVVLINSYCAAAPGMMPMFVQAMSFSMLHVSLCHMQESGTCWATKALSQYG